MSESPIREHLKARGLLPHQVEFVETALDSMPGGRILLADDVGLGKTHACIALAWALAQELGREPRMLILAPHKALLAQWQSGLIESGSTDALIIDSAAYRKLEARTSEYENPWMAVRTALTTIDFAKRDDRVAAIAEASWDLVILEESHQATNRSQRGRVLRALWESELVGLMVAVSATPHTGYSEDFEPFTAPATRILRRRRRDLRDWDGNSLIPDSDEQIIELLPLELSAEEKNLYEEIKRFAGESSGDESQRLVKLLFVKQASSSLFALEQAVRRFLARPNLVAHGGVTQLPLLDTERPVNEQADLFEEGGDLVSTPESVDHVVLRRLLDLIDHLGADTKWRVCADVLRAQVLDVSGSAVIFSDFADTAEYLAGLLSSFECPVATVTGDSPDPDRRLACERLREEGGVLIVTAAGEGLNLPFVKLCIHYDIPWNPERIAQRFGRVHRYGATPGPVRHVAFSEEILLPETLARKLLSISSELDVPSDIFAELGFPSSSSDISPVRGDGGA